jgi:trimeric autotransporter adhesin
VEWHRNSDGSQTAKTLTELCITSINLKADLTDVKYADGSEVTGQTTFTRSDGSTGTVANTVLAADAQGYAVAGSANDNMVQFTWRKAS